MKALRRPSTRQAGLVEVSDAEWEILAQREHHLISLEQTLASVSGDEPIASLQHVAKVLPLAISVEMVGIRLLSPETNELHLVACEGLPLRSARDLALDPVPMARQRSIFALGGHHSQARVLGLRWLAGEWLDAGAETLGSITVGSRTERRPSAEEWERLRAAARVIGERLPDIDRREARLRRHSLALARTAVLEAPDVPEALLAVLRPREATVLELYVDGRSVDEIAQVLVISPHTVRTHIKLAFRRLGVHSRDEAEELVRNGRVAALM